jgi:hypothetical protein
MERLHNLESLVQELRVQLEQAKLATNSAAEGSSGAANVPASVGTLEHQSSKLVLHISSTNGRYVRLSIWFVYITAWCVQRANFHCRLMTSGRRLVAFYQENPIHSRPEATANVPASVGTLEHQSSKLVLHISSTNGR